MKCGRDRTSIARREDIVGTVVSSEKVSSSSSGTGLLPLFERMSSTVGCIHGLVEEAIWMT